MKLGSRRAIAFRRVPPAGQGHRPRPSSAFDPSALRTEENGAPQASARVGPRGTRGHALGWDFDELGAHHCFVYDGRRTDQRVSETGSRVR